MKSTFLHRITAFRRSNQALSLAGNVAASGLTVVSVSVLFRALPAADLGAWVFFGTLLGLADALRAGTLTTAFIRAYAGAGRARAAEVAGSGWMLAGSITAGLVGLVLLGRLWPAPVTNAGLALFLRWFPLTFVLTLPSFMAAAVLQAELRFDKLLQLRLLTLLAFMAGVGGLALAHALTLERVVYCNLTAAGLASAVALLRGWSRLPAVAARSGVCVRELLHFGKYSVGSYLGASLLRSSDTFIINFLLGPAPLAVYNLAGRFLELVEIPLRSFVATAMPQLSAAYNQGRRAEMVRIIQRNAGLLTWALLPVALGTVLLADLPIYLVGGAKYAGTEAANLLRIGIVLALLCPLDRFSGVALDVLNQPRLNLLKVLLMLALNSVGDYVGIRLCGNLYGVALASLPTIVGGFLFGYFLLNKTLPIRIAPMLRTGLAECRLLLNRLRGRPAPAALASVSPVPAS
jgi:O-antigen/teichoic acid export membrane protein